MPVDVITQILIERPRREVAAYATDPANTPKWYSNIEAMEWKTAPPLQVGSRVAFVAVFLLRRLAYTYEVTELVPDERIAMRTVEGPFPMETSYRFDEVTATTTRMTLRNFGEPSGFSRVLAPMVEMGIRRANQKDLARLKRILEAR